MKFKFLICFVLATITMQCGSSPSAPYKIAVTRLEDLLPDSDRYAVLVSVNRYADNHKTRPLQGPKNDMDLLAKTLLERFGFSPGQILRLHDTSSTKKNILEALAALKAKAGANKQLIFAFAGHGSYFDDDTQTEEADGRDETICPYDRDLTESGDILDDDLYAACAGILEKGAYLTLILDSCYSGNASKGSQSARMRTAPPLRSPNVKISPWPIEKLDPYSKRFTFLAASTEKQAAQETWFDSGPLPAGVYGAFSHALIRLLKDAEPNKTWESLLPLLADELSQSNQPQLPILRYGHRMVIFGEPQPDAPPTFRVSHVFEGGKKICLDNGELAGLKPGSLLSVYPFQPETQGEGEKPLAHYRVSAATTHHAMATLIETSSAKPSMVVRLGPVRAEANGWSNKVWSVVIHENTPQELVTYLERLIAKESSLALASSSPESGVRFFKIRYTSASAASKAQLHLEGFPSPLKWCLTPYQYEEVAKNAIAEMLRTVYWSELLGIRNPSIATDEPFPFDVMVERGSISDDFRHRFEPLPASFRNGVLTLQDGDIIRLSYTNLSPEPLFITVFFMGNNAGIDSWNRDQYDAPVATGATVVIETLKQIVPPPGRDWVKVFVNREKPFDPMPFLQGSKDPNSIDPDLAISLTGTWQTLELPLEILANPGHSKSGVSGCEL